MPCGRRPSSPRASPWTASCTGRECVWPPSTPSCTDRECAVKVGCIWPTEAGVRRPHRCRGSDKDSSQISSGMEEHKEQRSNSLQYLLLLDEQELWRQLGRRAAVVWAEELHRRGRSSSSMGRGAPPAGARAGKKEQHGLAREIEEDEMEIEEEARELLVHRIVEAVSGEARRG
ncbi:uncharacterized protein LOC119291408 [Triticum dicoccoides]|uniref:uncharacterized protein LOC119291408 n=1 Tax=Triticum dicoccoides TaxID=85692 RepID=UPI00188EBF5C|nr:uncharacterized protein LOC119291408 [Triticum dicoccoides]